MYAKYSQSVSNSSPLTSADVFSARSYPLQFDPLLNVAGSLHQEYDDEIFWSVFVIFCRCCILQLVKKNKHGLCVLRLELMFSRSRFPGT